MKISKGGDLEKQKAIKGRLEPWGDNESKKMCEEVFKEVFKEVMRKSLQDFNNEIAKFKAPDERDTKLPEDLLRRRMAVCCLKIASLPEPIVVISIHNYHSAPKGSNYARFFLISWKSFTVLC